jgi:NigD-like C-terminal beta sandwich domain
MKTHFASILLIVLPISHYSNAAEEAPNIPSLTVVEQGLVKIKDIKSDPFTMTEVKIIGGVIRIKVSYAGGHKDHDFTLYRGNTVKESKPPQIDVYLKHNANGDKAEALLIKTLEFNLADLNKPIIITIHTDHGGKETVKYGENNTNAEGGADQPATAPELKSEGKDKPQPESKVRPR